MLDGPASEDKGSYASHSHPEHSRANSYPWCAQGWDDWLGLAPKKAKRGDDVFKPEAMPE